jgi:hypothetical protein
MYVKKVWRIIRDEGGNDAEAVRDFYDRAVVFCYRACLSASQTALLLYQNMLNPVKVPIDFDPTAFVERHNWSKQ